MRTRRLRAALALGLVIAGVLALVIGWPRGSALSCNGSRALCDRTYNRVTYLTAHNAMSSSERGFLGAEQGPDLVGQLDEGVRGLMLDLHYWTTPAEAAPVLAALPADVRAVVAPLVRSVPSRPGIWLCHDICQIGADPAVAQLALVRAWLAQHPHEVVTLILEDDISLADLRTTLTAAGLDPWLATPPARAGPWPTLRQLIDRHRTLLVFTQHARPTSGPIRNFYQLAAETPFDAPTAAAFSCAPDRGGQTAPLFLINNWIALTIPTRAAAVTVNNPTFLGQRVRRCETQRGLRATFVAVDFADSGPALAVVNQLNARG